MFCDSTGNSNLFQILVDEIYFLMDIYQ